MQFRESLPNINRLSIVTATIMLAFALTLVVSFPAPVISLNLLGIVLEFSLNYGSLTILLTSLLAAAGMEWLLQSHPTNIDQENRLANVRHWIVPVLTTFVIGVTLENTRGEVFWWVAFILGSLLLLAVFIAEYNVVEVGSVRHPIAAMELTGLSFTLYLLMIIAIYSADLRLYVRLPLIAIGALMVISRAIFLRLGDWHVLWSLVCSLVVTEIAVGFHYLPIAPMQIGLVIVGVAYALTGVVSGIKESRRGWAFWAEPVGMLGVLILIGLILL
ncbi:MAG: hypothetical protein H0S82_08155 [Anaerolineaceae bacterium]|nr:hypothetical protein [Anaerolineaceae bacterium]